MLLTKYLDFSRIAGRNRNFEILRIYLKFGFILGFAHHSNLIKPVYF